METITGVSGFVGAEKSHHNRDENNLKKIKVVYVVTSSQSIYIVGINRIQSYQMQLPINST